MSPADFLAFLAFAKDRFGWSEAEAARQLGCDKNSITNWKRYGAPKYIELACSTLCDQYTPIPAKHIWTPWKAPRCNIL